jgi:hypothetical protein
MTIITTTRRLLVSLWLGLLIPGCDSNPEGPRAPRQSEADARKSAPDPPLPRRGRDNPRGLQYAKPD